MSKRNASQLSIEGKCEDFVSNLTSVGTPCEEGNYILQLSSGERGSPDTLSGRHLTCSGVGAD